MPVVFAGVTPMQQRSRTLTFSGSPKARRSKFGMACRGFEMVVRIP